MIAGEQCRAVEPQARENPALKNAGIIGRKLAIFVVIKNEPIELFVFRAPNDVFRNSRATVCRELFARVNGDAAGRDFYDQLRRADKQSLFIKMRFSPVSGQTA